MHKMVENKQDYKFPNLVGTHIGQFIITKDLPRVGLMSAIYVAETSNRYQDIEYRKREVVIKIARNDATVFDESLVNEVKCLQNLRHPNIIHLLPMLTSNNILVYWLRAEELKQHFNGNAPFYYSMEYLKGRSLYDYLYPTPPNTRPKRPANTLSQEEWMWNIELIYQIAITIDYLHRLNIAHRDIKPDNIIFRKPPTIHERPHPVLIDFGLWSTGNQRLDTTLERAGSPHYLSPERVIAKKLAQPNQPVTRDDYANHLPSDIWALGIITHEIFYGHHPFSASLHDDTKLANAIINEPLQLKGKWENVKSLISRMLTKVREDRPTIREVIDILETEMGVLPPRI